MKKVILMALAVAAVTACSKSESTPEVDGGQKQQLNILTSVGTRTVVAGTTMPQGSAIGVHVTQGSVPVTAYVGQDYTTPGGAILQYGDNVRFDNGTDPNVWVSQTAASAAAKLMVGAEVGTVYAYYPYAATVTGVGTAATIPATILKVGNIDLTSAAAGSANYDTTEEDFLYYKPAATRNTVSSATTATSPLSMVHAMASVSFRIYVDKNAPAVNAGDANYYLMGYTIKNKTGKSLFKADDTGATMNIADGTITTPSTSTLELSRTINSTNGYVLFRATADPIGNTEKDDLVWVSNLVFPISAIPTMTLNGATVSQDMELVFSIKKGATGTAANYTVPIAVTPNAGTPDDGSDRWLAGKNYQYTIKLNGSNQLNIEQVTVTDWVDVIAGDMEIK